MKRILLFLMVISIDLSTYSQNVLWFSTTEGKYWNLEKKLPKPIDTNETYIEIDSSKEEQKMNGFGGCFNEAGWEALKLLEPSQTISLFKELFSPENANFCYNRFPIGGSDYSNGFYSFNETKDDFEMVNFSISRDINCLIPYIKMAQSYNKNMRFFASPWCPPSWMKTNEHYACKSSDKFNNLDINKQSVSGTTGFKMLDGYLHSYALYFSKFLDAYKNEGIDVSDLHVQNEVVAEQIFPSCIWEPQDLALFITDYLGPRFEKENRDINIWFSTLNVGDPNYVRKAFENEQLKKYITGMGFQWDGKNAIDSIHKEYPEMRLIQTENECGNGENSWSSALHMWELMKKYINNGAESYIYWNFILTTPGVSNWGWQQNSMVTINKNSGEITYNPEFYLMKHFSHFIKEDAFKIYCKGYDDVMAFKNPDNTYVVILYNKNSNSTTFNIKIDDELHKFVLKGNSFNTIKF